MSTLPAVAQLHRAIAISEEIQKLEAELASILGSTGGGGEIPTPFSMPEPAADVPKTRGRKKVSAETRAKMKAAQQARHAKKKGSSTPTPVTKAESAAAEVKTTTKPVKKTKGKRIISAEHRAKLAEAAKKRWAKVK